MSFGWTSGAKPSSVIVRLISKGETMRVEEQGQNKIKEQGDLLIELHHLAGYHHNLGFSLMKQHKHDEAIPQFELSIKYRGAAIKAIKKQGENAPAMWLSNLAQSYFYLASNLAEQDKYDESITQYKLSIEYRCTAIEKQGENVPAKWLNELAITHHNLGSVLDGQGKQTEAIKQYKLSIEHQGSAIEKQGENVSAIWLSNLGLSHYNLGDVLDRQTRHDKAIKQYKLSIEHQCSAIEKQGENVPAKWLSNLAITQRNLGSVLDRQGKEIEAITRFELSIEHQGSAIEKQGENVSAMWLRKLAFFHHILGSALEQKDELDKAIKQYKFSIEYRGSAIEKQGENVPAKWLNNLAHAHHNLGVLLVDQRKQIEAITQYELSIKSQGTAIEKKGEYPPAIWLNALALSHRFLGSALETQCKLEQAKQHCKTEIFTLAPMINNIRNDVNDLTPLRPAPTIRDACLRFAAFYPQSSLSQQALALFGDCFGSLAPNSAGIQTNNLLLFPGWLLNKRDQELELIQLFVPLARALLKLIDLGLVPNNPYTSLLGNVKARSHFEKSIAELEHKGLSLQNFINDESLLLALTRKTIAQGKMIEVLTQKIADLTSSMKTSNKQGLGGRKRARDDQEQDQSSKANANPAPLKRPKTNETSEKTMQIEDGPTLKKLCMGTLWAQPNSYSNLDDAFSDHEKLNPGLKSVRPPKELVEEYQTFVNS